MALQLEGQRFERLVVTGRAGKTDWGNVTWDCECDCGTSVEVAGSKLKSGHTRSCGCLVREFVAEQGLDSRTTHGHCSDRAHSSLYGTWNAMHQRCRNPNNRAYKHYGGRGVRVCERWSSFENFLEDMGERPGILELDRINNDGNYEPENCRWTDRSTQLRNRRSSRV